MVNTRLRVNGNFLAQTQNTILSAASILALASGVSAILGFVKGRLLAGYFGVSDELAVFYTADRIPNLIYSIVVVGALSTIFIPVFTHMRRKDEKDAWDTASYMINSTLLFFFLVGTVIFVFAPQIMSLLALNQFSPVQVALGADLMRIMLTAQLILVASSFATCVLQSYKYFLIPALSPIVYSLGMVFGIIALSDRYGIYGPAYGVIVGAVLHFLIQLPLLKKVGFSFSFSLNLKDKGIREIFSLMPPRLLSVLIANAMATINNSLAILISAPSVVFLKFASQLQFFPIHLFGMPIAAALLPTLSAETSEKNLDKFKKTFITSLHQMLFLVLPASVILLVLRIPVVRLVYGVDNFPWEATVKTAYALAFFSLSAFAQSSVYMLTRAFYALRDTKTPVVVSGVTIIINVLLSVIFVKTFGFGVWSVALSFTITSLIDLLALMFLLSRKVGGFSMESLIIPFTKISYATVFMGLSLYIPLKLLDEYVFDSTRTVNLLVITVVSIFAGIASYLFFTKIFRVKEVQLLYRLVSKLKINSQKPAVVIETSAH
ncbi:MAG: putative peptidoglycan lipid II flippase MurJ [candidate division WWE3 bacterium GW2011_GWC1_41_7]|uniref:Probable lipid II flippase MurJ n=1 Tax=candidate division WWE3 bacterium GW2011_GWC1_41_7 TaxID=1619119 RepID=A0A0G0X4A6_UNCKA|nr:MAG: putative peptidoglycan lipid II flippase MurJ [candidate division WWE3 bacterium GW2011_GWC1_41_7]